ncbi:hypothetical protein [Streptomyces exfoliatus]|uniref:hypothetical protein n=1 Tax=Streptomyces exfoliatus TaxID=1905 RepID=UPI003C2CD48E
MSGVAVSPLWQYPDHAGPFGQLLSKHPVLCYRLVQGADQCLDIGLKPGDLFGHDPSSVAERVGDIVRLTFDAYGTDGSPVIELSVDQARRLVAGAQQDLQDFLGLAGIWAEQHLPAHAAAVTAALARSLDLAPTH